jgi:hypothetical protein
VEPGANANCVRYEQSLQREATAHVVPPEVAHGKLKVGGDENSWAAWARKRFEAFLASHATPIDARRLVSRDFSSLACGNVRSAYSAFRSAYFGRLLLHCIDRPFAWYALQLVLPSLLELKAAARD